jgi:hypothetical protein
MNKPIALQHKAKHAAYDITPEEWRMRVEQGEEFETPMVDRRSDHRLG